MRCQNIIVEISQRPASRRLLLAHIQPRARESLLSKRREQSLFLHDLTSRKVEEKCARFHPAKLFVTEKMLRLRSQRHMAGDEVRARQQVIERDQFRARFR